MTGRTYSIDDVKAVILIGGRDFGRCRTASRLNRALWPLAGKPVLQHLIEHIACQGVRRFVLCCETESKHIRNSLMLPDYLDVRCIEETMPRGTAGCIRDAADPGRDELLFVFQACTLTPPDIHEMIQKHRTGDCIMTMFFNPPLMPEEAVLQDAQLYACESSILDCIPRKGYFDIKEGLVPTLVSAEKTVFAATLASSSGHFRMWRQYVQAVGVWLNKIKTGHPALTGFQSSPSRPGVWIGEGVHIAESARLVGPIIIEAGAQIDSDAVILGPALIGPQAVIGSNACVEHSVIWKAATMGRKCHIRQSLIDENFNVPSGVQLDNQLAARPQTGLGAWTEAMRLRIKYPAFHSKMEERVKTFAELLSRPQFKNILLLILGLLFGTLMVSYWQPTLNKLWHIWLESDEYSSGLLVPPLALYVLWSRRHSFYECIIQPAWTGLAMLLAAQGFRLFGLYFMFASAERLAFVLSIGAIVLLLLGWRFFLRFVPIFIFLFLMLPLPNRVESIITQPLQSWATVSAVYLLETLGYSVIRQGNVIQIGDTLVAVAEACNGLRMLTAFFVISGFVVLISQRKFWEKIIVLLSTIPIALICNTIRLALTSIAFTKIKTEDLEKIAHDFGGLAMMPLAIGIIILELWMLKHLFSQPESIEHQVVISRKDN
ncbi:MAG: Bifunctional protein GlmU [Pelotomaculum sp. PtaB.Bin104]|jgi:exosortase|nr:MAG: Bifunctional protein GlmU [Pelotomaculum sp. PtaB.Bin104]